MHSAQSHNPRRCSVSLLTDKFDIRSVTKSSVLRSTEVSEEHVAFIFTVEEQVEQKISVKAGSSETSIDLQQTARRYIP
jgi:hypothetical protein